MRILITGGPRTGKTTLAKTYVLPTRRTDDLMDLPWSEQSLVISKWMDADAPWVIEGVAIPRSLRKWLTNHPTATHVPFDKLIYLRRPQVMQTPGQHSMDRATWTVFEEIRPVLMQRNALIVVLDRKM